MIPSLHPAAIGGFTGLAITAIASASAAEPGVWRLHDAHVLGTRMNLVVVADSAAAAEAAGLAARAEVDRLDHVLNSRRPGAELHSFNLGAGGVVSKDLYEVIAAAEHWRGAADGAFDARMGRALAMWREATLAPPAKAALAQAVGESAQPITFDPATRQVRKSPATQLAMDGVAKGYIVDRALEAAKAAAPGVHGLAVEIGGDIRCWGRPPEGGLWRFGVSDPLRPGEDADCAASVHIAQGAIATSGRGPRDRIIGEHRFSATLSPSNGWPVEHSLAATVVASCAAEADALATAFLTLEPERAIQLADRMPGVAARITQADGGVLRSDRWTSLAAEPPARLIRAAGPASSKLPPELRWPADWGVEMTYVAPDKQDNRNADFRTPYMALWISDAANRPVRTVIMVGKEADWHRDNFIWWSSYKGQTQRMVDLRSEATALSGRYSLFWRGVDDGWNSLPVGDYILHIETSQERGKHSHRTLPLKIGRQAFSTSLPATQEGGGLLISYGLKR